MPPRRSTVASEISLPDLTPFDGEGLGAGGDYVAIDFVGLDFAGADAPDARFLECRLQRCGLDGASLRRARIAESLLSDLHAAVGGPDRLRLARLPGVGRPTGGGAR